MKCCFCRPFDVEPREPEVGSVCEDCGRVYSRLKPDEADFYFNGQKMQPVGPQSGWRRPTAIERLKEALDA